MSRIRLLYVITKLELGGAQKQLLELIRNLDKNRYRIFLFTADKGFLLKDVESISDIEIKKSRFLERSINPLKDILALIELYLFIKKFSPHIVHTHSSKAGILARIAARLAGVKIIIHTVHGWSFHEYQNKFLGQLFMWLEKKVAFFTTRIIVVSEYDLKKGLNNIIGNRDKYTLITYGIECNDFKKEKDLNLKKELGLNPQDLIVGMVACFKPQKGIFDFIEVTHRISQCFSQAGFLLVGDGILRAKIEAEIKKFNLKEKFVLTGWRTDIARLLSIMDIFVLTSLWEGLPIVVLEAMASGKPVVVTNTGGIAEVIKDSVNGFLVVCRDIDTITEKILVLLKDKTLREKLGMNAYRSLNNKFSLAQMIKETDNLYRQLLTKIN